MPPRKHARRQKCKQTGRRVLIVLTLVLVLALVAGGIALLVKMISGHVGVGESGATTTTGPRDPAVIATATLGSSGDILVHNPVRVSGYDSATKTFDYSDSFAFLQPYVSKLDYAVVNAEFSVSANGSYSSLPFRVPAAIVKALRDCGYDMGLTANNHIADGGTAGIKKTMETLAEYGMDYTGSRQNTEDDRYSIKDVNGIKIGIVNYTYGSYWHTNGFSTSNLPAFYEDAGALIAEMRNAGAELIYLYIHWGQEYSLAPNASQQEIAQKMCDLGVDVIIGGHPHKIQPVELIHSTTGDHQTICLYSSGNLLSGQQIECMAGGTQSNSPYCYQDSWHFAGCDYPDVADRTKDTHRLEHGTNCNDNGHTEDGVVFHVTATKYEDGTVMISSVDVLPVWCMGREFVRAGYPTNSSFKEYILIPLDKSVNWASAYGLTEVEATEAGYSYDRTMQLLGEGIAEINAACQTTINAYVDAFKQAQLTATTATTTAQ
ncbi:MAG: CapA family protein [Clostridia bacterium]|nr:CapA family protein [Clostridia bacterium]